MNFGSDNTAPVAAEIMEALNRANDGKAPAYGADDWTARLEERMSALFEREVAVFPVATGTAANALALSALMPPWGRVYCHRNAHIAEDECGAPILFTGGGTLELLDGPAGQITPDAVRASVANLRLGDQHQTQPAVISITQATEWGTVYNPEEVAALADLAREYGMSLHMDGARFANALVHLNCSPAEATWKAGVDVLSFGATKNGAMAAEAVVFFDPAKAENFLFRRKRTGHLFSKMRYLSVQLLAYLEDDLWLKNARRANEAASRLAGGLKQLPGAELAAPVQANEIFIRLPAGIAEGLREKGYYFYDWPQAGPGGVRLVTAYDTPAAAVDGLVADALTLPDGGVGR